MSFDDEVQQRLQDNGKDAALKQKAHEFFMASADAKYSYNFSWLGRPIIQYPQDIVAMQEIIWRVQPDLIIETGIAHGGSLIFSAAMLELNAACGGPADGQVLGIDIDIRSHNRQAIEAHPMAKRIRMMEGSSISPEMIAAVHAHAAGKKRVLVCLDSNHTHDHVLKELQAYAMLTSPGSYCVVFDTIIENMPADYFPDRPWKPGDNPMTAVDAFLTTPDGQHFEIDERVDHQLMVSVAPRGYLFRKN